MRKSIILILLSILSFYITRPCWGQAGLTLPDVINRAQTNSVEALIAKHSYLSKYWQFRSYKAQFVPSLWLSGSLPSFNRGYTQLQDWQTGEYNYVENYSMTNSLDLNLRQNIAATGGSISLNTSLLRLDQYSPNRDISYNSRPIYLRIDQPIGGFNQFKWDKKIEPVKYEQAKFEYLEAIGTIAERAITYFFEQLEAEQNLMMAQKNHENQKALYKIAQERFKIGSMPKDQLMQLELGLLNAGLNITNRKVQLDLAQARLRTYLGFKADEELSLIIPETFSNITIPLEKAYELSIFNTSFTYANRIKQLEAEKIIAQTKANLGPSMNLSADFGLNQVGNKISEAYRRPSDQENVMFTLSIPILDGGVRKGNLRMAQSQQEVAEAQIETDLIDRRQNLYMTVMQFNNQNMQCIISQKADSIAQERYILANKQFAAGNLSVTELNTAQGDKDDARNQYISSLRDYWYYYFTIQRYTLFDFIEQKNISELFDRTEFEK